MAVIRLSTELLRRFTEMEREAYSYLVAGDFSRAEQVYKQQYDALRTEEERLSLGNKYHKGGPLHNWGISLLLQNKVLDGFQRIALAYIEDLLDSATVDDALGAPAFRTLRSYSLISDEFLNRLKELATARRLQNRVPRDPEEVMTDYREAGHTDLPSSFTLERLKGAPITIDQVRPLVEEQLKKIGPKEKRVFVGGSYKNIAVLRHIAYQIVEGIDEFKAVLPIDLPNLSAQPYDHLIHDLSMEYLRSCSFAIFEVSVSDGHLMEIERACDLKRREGLRVVLVFQKTKAGDEPYVTRMLISTDFEKKGYRDFGELATEIRSFLEL